ncbi:tetratricopeptide repeat protein [Embleya sp. NPDC008237]|uniref:tetratricopeptide repeat protein n=1 Tax=Embleya sp. NPDC008237 TaxID=3363978 RepID=UPI0036E343D1
MISSCAGEHCKRLVSLSEVPGGNPVALRDPEGFAVSFLICGDCKLTFCERCDPRRIRLIRALPCGACGGKLFDGNYWRNARRQPTPEAVVLHDQGYELAAQGQLAEAITVFRDVIRQRPRYVRAHIHLAAALDGVGDAQGALEAVDRALRIASDNPAALVDRANYLTQLSRGAEAVIAYDRAIKRLPAQLAAHVNKSLVLLDLNRVDEAVAACTEAVRLATTGTGVDITPTATAAAHGSLGAAYHRAGRHDLAVNAADQAIQSDPDNPQWYTNRANALMNLGRPAEARRDRETAAALAAN